jgi:hypothetical protein
MIKILCDVCKNEINIHEKAGNFRRAVASMDAATMQPRIGEQSYDLCEKCQIKMSESLDKLKNEFNQ